MVLPAREPTLTAHVFEHDQAPSRLKRAADLGKRPIDVLDAAQHAGEHDRVDAVVALREGFRRRVDELERQLKDR